MCKSDVYVSIFQIEEGAAVDCYKDSCGAKHNTVKLDEDRSVANRFGYQSLPCKNARRISLSNPRSMASLKTAGTVVRRTLLGGDTPVGQFPKKHTAI